MNNDEKWEWIKGYENRYLVSTYGQILATPGHHHEGGIYKLQTGKNGYFIIRLFKDGKYKSKYVHRLVAETFIPNPENKKYINHKNGIKTDNRIENLEWVTLSENLQHAYDTGLQPKIRRHSKAQNHPVIMDGTTYFESINQAAKALNISCAAILRVLNGKRNHVHSHTFKYAEKEPECK